MTPELSETLVDLVRELKLAHDEARAFRELLSLALARQHDLERNAKRDEKRIAELCETNKSLRRQAPELQAAA